ncbi:MAG TPA: hypothetical protein VF101_14460 [Gaiellaceae bacterium]
MADHVRLEIAFDGGQIMGALVSTESADALDKALASGEDANLTLEAADGRYTVALRRVVYLKRFSRESRVGFGSQ